MQEFLFQLSIQQDYFWFLAGAAWLLVWLTQRRIAPADPAWCWVPVAASAVLATVALELSLLVTPVAADPYHGPRAAWDFGLGLVAAWLLTGWTWAGLIHRRKPVRWGGTGAVALLAGAVATYRLTEPAAGSWALSLLLTLLGAGWLRSVRQRPLLTLALAATCLAMWASSAGPFASTLHSPRSTTDLSPLGAPAAALWIVAAIGAGLDLVRRSAREALARAPEARVLGRQVAIAASLWVALGLGLAWSMGALAARQFALGAAGRVRAGVVAIDPAALARALGPGFRLGESQYFTHRSGGQGIAIRPEGFEERQLIRISEALTELETANPDIDWARVLVAREGRIIGLLESTRLMGYGKSLPGTLAVQGVFSADDWSDWSDRAARLAGPLLLPHGAFMQARAPLISREGRMLGWLAYDFSPSVWVQAQAQARVLVFGIVALGGVLLLLYWLHQLSTLERSAAIRAAAAATAADQAKTHFLARVSHELRTPVQSILGYGELLAGTPLPDEPRHWLGAMRSQGQLLIRLVNDLIDLSALETGAFRLTPSVGELGELIRSTTESLEPRARAKQLELTCEISSSLPPWFRFDRERVRQVVLNLITNAIKFTARGRVTVRVHWTAENRVRLEVIDTGPGIAIEDQARIFRPFVRLEQNGGVEGSGLGLALCAAICASMDGTLRLESDGTNGSRFIVELPMPPAAPPDTEAPALAVSIVGRRVLVADDNPLVRDLFVTGLRNAGAWCDAVSDGLEAIERCASQTYDVVVLDLSMPWLDGLETARRLRALRPVGLRLIGVSAHAAAADRAAAEAAGMHTFLLKPVSIQSLVSAVALVPSEQIPPTPHPGDLVLIRRLAEHFRREAQPLAAELTRAAADDDRRQLRARVHYLKNSADVVGQAELSVLCAQLEDLLSQTHRQPTGDAEIRARTNEICTLLLRASRPTE